MNTLLQQALFIGQGISLSLSLLIGGVTLGFMLGIVLAILRHQRIAALLIHYYISMIRSTPLILQLSFVYFASYQVTGFKPSIITAGILAFGLNSSAYFAEILRAGIESLPKGQFEAAKTLNIPILHLWKDIILPQVLTNTFPILIAEVIALLKETALIATIGGMDLMRHAQVLAAAEFTYFTPLCIAALYYYGLVLLIESTSQSWAKRRHYAACSQSL